MSQKTILYRRILEFPNVEIEILKSDIGLKYLSFLWFREPNTGIIHQGEAISKRLSNDIYNIIEDYINVCDNEAKELSLYFNRQLHEFTITLDYNGTPFKKSVWDALTKVPYGNVRTYSEIAETIGNPKAVRAAASAIGNNPISIIIPCHRIIGKNGKLTGFSGPGDIRLKEFLLKIEGYL